MHIESPYNVINTPRHTSCLRARSLERESAKGGVFILSMKFSKPAFNSNQLITKLVAQGFVIDPADSSIAPRYFDYIGAHRIKGYWYSSVDPSTKKFRQGRDNFQYLVQQVNFDDEMRALLWRVIGKVELAVRAAMANYLSMQVSPHWFLDRSLFKHTRDWSFGQILRKIEDEVGRLNERKPVKHYFDKYTDPYLPPSWVMSECVTLGFWSRTYQALADTSYKKTIAGKFGVNQPTVFESWLHSVTYLRNLVAHHGQILGVQLRIAPQNYKGTGQKGGTKGASSVSLHLGSDTKSLYAAVKMMNFLINRTHLPNSLKADLQGIFSKYPSNFMAAVGFPANWTAEPGW